MDTQLTDEEQQLLLKSQAAESTADSPLDDASVRRIEIAAVEQIKRGKLPGLDLLAERFARTFRGDLSTHLGRVSDVQIQKIEFCRFSEFYKTLELPSNLHLFRLNPLPSQGLLVFSNQLVAEFIEVLFGAGGMPSKKAVNLKRELSAIEQRIVSKVAMLTLDCFADSWANVREVENVYISSESNPLALQAVTPSEHVAILRFEVELGNLALPLSFCLPFSQLAPVRDLLEKGGGARVSTDSTESDVRIRKELAQAMVKIHVEIAEGSHSVRDILALKVGDILQLSTPAEQSAKVFVEGSLKFRGTTGEARGSKVLKITSAVGAKK